MTQFTTEQRQSPEKSTLEVTASRLRDSFSKEFFTDAIFGVLSVREGGWIKNQEAVATQYKIPGRVEQVLEWLVTSADVGNIEEVGEILTDKLSKTVDRQSSVGIPGYTVPDRVTKYHQAAEHVLEILKPFMKENKQDPVKAELDQWAGAGIDLSEEDYERIHPRVNDLLVVYTPKGQGQDVRQKLIRWFEGSSNTTTPSVANNRIHVVMIEGLGKLPYEQAIASNGRHIIMDPNSMNEPLYLNDLYNRARDNQQFGGAKK